MLKGASTIKIDVSSIQKFGENLGRRYAKYDEVMEDRTQSATDIVFRTARARRPMITAAQMKKEGRSHRVSDPNASLGVPVAAINGGRLQASIQKKVERVGYGVFRGVVWTNLFYAKFVEYGTSRMRARPFMRPAAALNRQAIKRLYNLNVGVSTS